MDTRIGQKIPNPTWTPTAGIRQRSLERGITLPPVIPAGPNNPLGRYALRLAHGAVSINHSVAAMPLAWRH